jgi:2-C-methyl-D-erythritol 2,4-cyclodiphosphate synthase
MDIRTGFGYDIHRLREGDHLLLGSVRVPASITEEAHSDGDIVLHALSQAILASLGLEDIGTYFPDSSKATEGMDSTKILAFALSKMKEQGYALGNVSVTILLEKPKLFPDKPRIRKALAALLGIGEDRIAVHANTGEKVGPVGEGKAIVVYAEVLIKKD